MSYAIECRSLVKTYAGNPPVEAVRGLELAVHTGECFGLLGPNGAGKTTTLEMIEGLLEVTSGEIEILGKRWTDSPQEIREQIGISLQETRLPDKLTVLEVVRLFRSFYRSGLSPEEAIARVSIQEKANSYVVKLSGGQKQRLAIACAIVGDPKLLFLDEPTTGLDPQSRRQLWDIVTEFKNSGRTVVITTHYMDEAERLCDRVAVIDQGKVIALGTPSELISRLGGQHMVDFTLTDSEAHNLANQLEGLNQLKGVISARTEAGQYSLTVSEPHIALPALLEYLRIQNRNLATLSTRSATLEDVFVNLTGRHLRDNE
ncbi:MAG: ABC transporter ATP-binding protein [Gemmataceae bacterium]|jgi:ABC-2 type transport system ATP-binding protein|nr:ABC transporter ATP-binding protein [Gemmataceae bacterium]